LRRQALAGDVREDLGCAQDEQGTEDDDDADRPARDRRGEYREDRGPREVDTRDDPATIDAIGDRPGRDAEEQIRQPLDEDGGRDDERIARLLRDEQRTGGERDPVTDVRDDR